MDKDTLNEQELLAEIQKQDPGFMVDASATHLANVFDIKPGPDISHYIPTTIADFQSITPAEPEYVFYPCLPTQGICLIYAASGLGKTLFALNLAYAVAAGGSFLNYKCPKPRRVLYIDGEMSFYQIHERVMNIVAHQGELDFKENFCVLTPDKVYPRRIPKIDDQFDQQLYIKLIEQYEIEVIVFDNVSMLSSIDENKACEWKIVQDFLLNLKMSGKSVILVHHAGKDKNGYRGTSRMLDCVNTAISLQPINDDSLESDQVSGKKFKIVYQKSRDFGGKEALPFEVTLDKGIWSTRSIELSELDKVIDLHRLGMKQREIAHDMSLSLGKVNKLINKAKVLKLIRDQ